MLDLNEMRELAQEQNHHPVVTISREELRQLLELIDANESQELERMRLTQGF